MVRTAKKPTGISGGPTTKKPTAKSGVPTTKKPTEKNSNKNSDDVSSVRVKYMKKREWEWKEKKRDHNLLLQRRQENKLINYFLNLTFRNTLGVRLSIIIIIIIITIIITLNDCWVFLSKSIPTGAELCRILEITPFWLTHRRIYSAFILFSITFPEKKVIRAP